MKALLPMQGLWALLATILLAYQGLARASTQAQEDPPDWLELGGLVEIAAAYAEADGADPESTLNVSTVELGLVARINPMITAEATLLYEDDGEQELSVDVAAITLLPTDNWAIIGGQFYLPFGVYESAMISDPLTLQLGEIRETAVMVSRESGEFTTSVYLFAGDISEGSRDKLDNYGLSVAYAVASNGIDFAGSAGYINDIQDSDTIQDLVGGPAQRAGGTYLTAVIGSGPVRLIAEYVGATGRIQTGEKPRAFNLEVDYQLQILSHDATFALGMQSTHDAAGLGLAQSAVLTALSVGIREDTSLAFEYARSESYNGDDTGTLTAQLAVEF